MRARAGRSSGCCELFPDLDPARILFTPNFAPRAEYDWALGAGRARHGRQRLRARAAGRSCSGARDLRAHRYRRRPRPPRSRAHRRHALQVRRAALGAAHAGGLAQAAGATRRRACRRTSAAASSTSRAGSTPRACWPQAAQRLRGPARHRRRRRPGRARAPRPAGRGPGQARHAARSPCAPSTRSSRCGSSRGATWWPHAGVLLARVTQLKSQGRGALRRRRHRNELAHPPGALWLVP